ncbi:nicotinate (nicotinamide) nucleotide adenylyltransferase [Xanthovirga aplysinae]|uniref:nicotinate (nicotinamide) nucleotide adenylyltransferase n=1 Tax=Xanthovirga aplysinae TaxID=2529853 RepID=UPI0012BB9364|nr:nicotinate (nicotinamide) nucleotide adenylyltransferase [Xanthovirga aplysinae]MTI30263.1 nicotinate-nucleotide adenylyltransferase [Xanthovirga aplysinae]
MNIGLFFGSFNPIHLGHLMIAQAMLDNTEIEQVWFIVSPQNPFKKSKALLHEFDRLEMVELAIGDNFNFRASDLEFHMPRPSYTVDTLTYLSEKFPQHQFKLIIGEDNLKSFPKWKNAEKILELYELYVYPRPNAVASIELKNHPHVKMVDAPMVDISATFIRRAIQEGKSVNYLVPEKVAEHIYARKLYK